MSSSDSPATEWSGNHSEKDALRDRVWSALADQKAVRRNPFGHIPNFIGAEQAAERLAELPIWQTATTVKCNPDSPQMPVRLRALQEGKRLYMAVPRLSRKKCFVELTAKALMQKGVSLKDAAYMRNALIHGKLVSFEEMVPIDLVIVGCVAASSQGGRTGKGAGFADLELAMLTQFGLIQPATPIVTTVHDLQLVDASLLPMQPHDWAVNWVITPNVVVETHPLYAKPNGIDWDTIRPEQLKAIPILRSLHSVRETP